VIPSPAPPPFLARALALLLLLPLAAAQDSEKDSLAGMDAEVRGDWVLAAQAFARAAEAAPGDTHRSLRLRMARQRGIAFWKLQIDALLKEKLPEDAARAVMVASLIDPDNDSIASLRHKVEQAGATVPPPPPPDGPVSPLFPHRSALGRVRAWSTLGAPFGKACRLIDAAQRFLVEAQDKKGQWDAKKYGGDGGYDTAITGLALLTLMVDGPGGLVGDRGIAARRAADYLVDAQRDDGGIGSNLLHSHIYCATLATEALAEYGIMSGDTERIRKTLERARDFLVDAQTRGAGWGYKSRDSANDTSITGRAVYALQRLRLAGVDVPDRSMRDAMAWIESMVEPNFGQIGYNFPGGAPARPAERQDTFPPEYSHSMTAAGLLATCYIGAEPEWAPKAVALLAEVPPMPRYPDMYYWQLGSRAFVAKTGAVPANWYSALVDSAVSCSKADGGMADCGVWQGYGGRIYATAMTVLALAAPYSEPPPNDKAPTASSFLADGRREVVVPADKEETPTAIYVEPGMKLTVTTSGTIEPWDGSPRATCDGIKNDIRSYRPLLRGAPFACLLGRVGPEGRLFRIQERKPVVLSSCGQLYLLANDERPEDGTGEWAVRFELER